MSLTEVSSARCFRGFQKVFSHESNEVKCTMKFGVYIPEKAETEKVPVIFWLSGLTCTQDNFIIKSGFQRWASKHGFIVVNPDTSPRGCSIEGEDDSYDFGSGAGFYLDATEPKWKEHYRMYSYITKEFISLIIQNFNVDKDRMGVMGHSMGGHGALTISLKNPGLFKSVSVFAPISNPLNCQWGQKAFTGYLGADKKDAWKEYDSCELAKKYNGPIVEILVDQGTKDTFFPDQLHPDNFVQACRQNGVPVILRMQEGYDHSFFFIQTFLEEHFEHHAKTLCN